MNSPIGCHVKPLAHLDGYKFLPLCKRKIHVTKKGSVLIGDVVVSSIWYVIEMLCILESILATCFLTTDYPCKTNSIWKKMVEPAKRANPLFTLLEINHRVRFKIFGWTPLHKLGWFHLKTSSGILASGLILTSTKTSGKTSIS